MQESSSEREKLPILFNEIDDITIGCLNQTSKMHELFNNVSLTSGELLKVALSQDDLYDVKKQEIEEDISIME